MVNTTLPSTLAPFLDSYRRMFAHGLSLTANSSLCFVLTLVSIRWLGPGMFSSELPHSSFSSFYCCIYNDTRRSKIRLICIHLFALRDGMLSSKLPYPSLYLYLYLYLSLSPSVSVVVRYEDRFVFVFVFVVVTVIKLIIGTLSSEFPVSSLLSFSPFCFFLLLILHEYLYVNTIALEQWVLSSEPLIPEFSEKQSNRNKLLMAIAPPGSSAVSPTYFVLSYYVLCRFLYLCFSVIFDFFHTLSVIRMKLRFSSLTAL